MFEQSLDFAADEVDKGLPINDWEHVIIIDDPYTKLVSRFANSDFLLGCLGKSHKTKRVAADAKTGAKRLKIERSLAFMAAHKFAQKYFLKEFGNSQTEFSEAGKVVLEESSTQMAKAAEILKECDPREVELISSHKLCMILLNSGIMYVGKILHIGLLKDSEAEHWVERLEEQLEHVLACNQVEHPGEIRIPDSNEEEHCDHHGDGHRHSQGAITDMPNMREETEDEQTKDVVTTNGKDRTSEDGGDKEDGDDDKVMDA
eukprot:CAMPEP_0198129224 /NCGR_PEP_ID=MMETSP1442-20131203/51219_1 /TAXON_ID= /ORGANISM="Craspedostauros australis, Strain CCMP3328" /LENGTH=259 /DNA_ID=CAMNT_0043789579 /DNA_START=24 /DNA_END=803 /DNA_ORIENTATION=-